MAAAEGKVLAQQGLLENLKDELATTIAEKSELSQTLEQARKELEDAESGHNKALQAAKADAEVARKEVISLSERLAELQSKTAESNSHVAEVDGELQAAKEKFAREGERAKERESSLTDKVSQLEGELAKAREGLASERAAVEDANNQVEELLAKEEGLRKQIDELSAGKKALLAEIDELKAATSEASLEHDEVLSTLRKEIESVKKEAEKWKTKSKYVNHKNRLN